MHDPAGALRYLVAIVRAGETTTLDLVAPAPARVAGTLRRRAEPMPGQAIVFVRDMAAGVRGRTVAVEVRAGEETAIDLEVE